MKGATGAVLAGESFSQFLINILLKGQLRVNVTIGEQVYPGAVYTMDYAEGMDHIHARVWVTGLPPKDEDDNGKDCVRVWLYADGRVEVMPDELQDET